MKWEELIRIPLEGNSETRFYTKANLLLAVGYKRIVIGDRGPYIEFSDDQIAHDNIFIPRHAEHKAKRKLSYYHEYRSKDECYTKLYWQKIPVSYADYKIGMWYVSPSEVQTGSIRDLVALPSKSKESEDRVSTLFDYL